MPFVIEMHDSRSRRQQADPAPLLAMSAEHHRVA
jgi:hypothetical protein